MSDTTAAPSSSALVRRLLVGRNPKRTLLRAGITAIVLLCVFRFVLIPVRVVGASMEPAYRNGGVNLINRMAFLFREPRRGDVVSVRTTGISHQYLKRIIALPGETIAIRNGLVLINGEPLSEPYVVFRDGWNYGPVQLGMTEYLVIGDNRGMRMEDHTGGITQRGKLVGTPLL